MLRAIAIALVGATVTCSGLVGLVGLDDPDATDKSASLADKQLDADAARSAFERFKTLSGSWEGKSTKGWAEVNNYRVIARGSVVMGTSFDAHPNETMVTMFHMDGDRLMLTHYCVAKNQPRMVATEISADGAEVTFEFLDGTNMSSRDKGHMDKAVFRFKSDDEFTSQWTWYQDGQESWMEEIRNTRQKA